jgi:hypothetical protein
MKKKILPTLLLAVSLILSACGSEATPTVNAVDIQNTAMANAWLSITQTQAALPTATVTFTPAPTETATATFIVIPTLPHLQADQPTVAAPAGNPTVNPCNDIPPAKPNGALGQVRFVNKSGHGANLYFGMLQPNKLGECGTYSFSLGRIDTVDATVLVGCYWAYAYTDKPSTAANAQPLCVIEGDAVSFWITADLISTH